MITGKSGFRKAPTAYVWFLLILGALGCRSENKLAEFTLTVELGPASSPVVRGRCAMPDGALLLVHAQGGEGLGAQVETALLTTVIDGRYAADLGVYEPLQYRISVILSPAFNASLEMPAAPYAFEDPDLSVRETGEGWEITRESAFRLGTSEEERQALNVHLQEMEAALHELQRHAAALEDLANADRAAGLARWYRLYWENRRATILDDPGIDPFFPTLHQWLIQADETLQRRFHAVLAAQTGAPEEVEKLGAPRSLLKRRLAKADRELTEIRSKWSTP